MNKTDMSRIRSLAMAAPPSRLERQLATLRVVADPDVLPIADLALEQQPAQRRLQLALDDPLQRAGTVGRVVADPHQVLLRRVLEFEGDPPLRQPLPQPAQLHVHDLLQM